MKATTNTGRIYAVNGYWYYCSAEHRIAPACAPHTTRKGAVDNAKAAGFTKLIVERTLAIK